MMHLEWKPKYAYKMFKKEEQKNLITACIRRAASLHEIKIIVISVMLEHIHCEVQVSLNMSASKVLQILKGLSAKLFFEYQKVSEFYHTLKGVVCFGLLDAQDSTTS